LRTLGALFVAAFLLCANAFGHGGRYDKDGCHVDKSTGLRHCRPNTARSVCDGKVPVPGEENVLYGRVVSVHDGDTFKVKIQGAAMTFRMSDIDAPELDQPYGREARDLLTAALNGKDVVMLQIDSDNHGRHVVYVWIAKLLINREVVAQGAAWFYPQYAHDDCLYAVENNARDAKRGLWKLPVDKRVEPWVWRERTRIAADAKHKKKASLR